jgi:hypothetical protein
LHPVFVEFIRIEFSILSGRMSEFFETIKGALSHDGIENVINLAHQQRKTLGGRFGHLEEITKDDHFSKDTGRFGKR